MRKERQRKMMEEQKKVDEARRLKRESERQIYEENLRKEEER